MSRKRFNFARYKFRSDRLLLSLERRFARMFARALKEQQKQFIEHYRETNEVILPDTLTPIFSEIVEKVGWQGYRMQRQLLDATNKSIFRDTFSMWIDTFIQTRVSRIVQQINGTTSKRINELITRGFTESWTFEYLVNEFQQAGVFSAGRGMTVARTTIGAINNEVKEKSMNDWSEEIGEKGNMFKIWIHRGAKHPRDWHVALDNGIAIRASDPFVVADTDTGEVELMDKPHSMGASAHNTINCGCEVMYITEDYARDAGMLSDDSFRWG